MKLPLAEEKLENTLRSASQDAFTFLCFIEGIRHLCPDDLSDLFERFGQFVQKGRYVVSK